MSKPIYIYLTPFFPSPESWRGGYCLDAAKALIRDGRYDVRVMVPDRGDDYEWDGVKVYRFRRIVAPSGTVPFLLFWINNWFLRRKLKREGILAERVSVFHANTLNLGHYSACMKKLNPSCRTIIQFHSSYSLELRNGRLGLIPVHATLAYLYHCYICKSVDVLAFVSEMSRRTFGKRYVSNPEGEVRDVRSLLVLGKWLPALRLPRQVVVYNGIDTSIFNLAPKVSHEGFVIGCVANFFPSKDHMTLLRAVNLLKTRLPDLKVRLVGSGEMLDACKRYVAENDLENIVKFEAEVDHREMPNFYRSLDLLVMPSWLEGFLCVCTESLACGTPSLFCAGTPLADLLPEEDKNKWLFYPQDAADLANKVLAYRDNLWEQHFTVDLEINKVWREFLDRLDAKGRQ